MKKINVKKIIASALLLSLSIPAFAQSSSGLNILNATECQSVYQDRLLRTEVNRTRRNGLAVGAVAVALIPIWGPLGLATFGTFAVGMAGSGYGAQGVNKISSKHKGRLLPDSLKELMLMDSAINPDKEFALEDHRAIELFGKPAGYNYKIPVETKEALMDRFVAHLQKRANRHKKTKALVEHLTIKNVKAALLKLKDGKTLCQKANGDVKALNLRHFESALMEDMQKEYMGGIVEAFNEKDNGENDADEKVGAVDQDISSKKGTSSAVESSKKAPNLNEGKKVE